MGSSKKLNGEILSVKLKGADSHVQDEVILDTVSLPSDAPARMKTLKAEGKKWYLTVVYWPESTKPFALFCQTNCREGGANTGSAVEHLIELAKRKKLPTEFIEETVHKISGDSNVTKISRTLSLLLRHNVSIVEIVEELDKIDTIFVGSFLFQVKKFLSGYIKDGANSSQSCVECGSHNLKYSEGCLSCLECDYSKCG